MSSGITNAVEVRVGVTVARPRTAVWAVLADVQRQPEWMRDALPIAGRHGPQPRRAQRAGRISAGVRARTSARPISRRTM